jgi:CUE domain
MDNELVIGLLEMFPNLTIDTIEDVYRSCQQNYNQTVEALISLQSDTPTPSTNSQILLDDADLLTDEIFEKISKSEATLNEEKLKSSKDSDKELTKALGESLKQFKKDQKKMKKSEDPSGQNKLSFKDKLKNIFKKKPPPPQPAEKNAVEMPDISKSNSKPPNYIEDT